MLRRALARALAGLAIRGVPAGQVTLELGPGR
jgi:hypothetical protein